MSPLVIRLTCSLTNQAKRVFSPCATLFEVVLILEPVVAAGGMFAEQDENICLTESGDLELMDRDEVFNPPVTSTQDDVTTTQDIFGDLGLNDVNASVHQSFIDALSAANNESIGPLFSQSQSGDISGAEFLDDEKQKSPEDKSRSVGSAGLRTPSDKNVSHRNEKSELDNSDRKIENTGMPGENQQSGTDSRRSKTSTPRRESEAVTFPHGPLGLVVAMQNGTPIRGPSTDDHQQRGTPESASQRKENNTGSTEADKALMHTPLMENRARSHSACAPTTANENISSSIRKNLSAPKTLDTTSTPGKGNGRRRKRPSSSQRKVLFEVAGSSLSDCSPSKKPRKPPAAVPPPAFVTIEPDEPPPDEHIRQPPVFDATRHRYPVVEQFVPGDAVDGKPDPEQMVVDDVVVQKPEWIVMGAEEDGTSHWTLECNGADMGINVRGAGRSFLLGPCDGTKTLTDYFEPGEAVYFYHILAKKLSSGGFATNDKVMLNGVPCQRVYFQDCWPNCSLKRNEIRALNASFIPVHWLAYAKPHSANYDKNVAAAAKRRRGKITDFWTLDEFTEECSQIFLVANNKPILYVTQRADTS